jgi:SAM-dependent methyltransferase
MAAVMSGGREDSAGPPARAEDADGEIRRTELHRLAADLPALPGETASSFVARLLARLSALRPPDFASRLREKSAKARASGRPLRILSLGSGTATAEHALLEACDEPVELVLTGDDEASLDASLAKFHPRHRVTSRVTDLEAGLATWKDRFDVVFSHATLSRVIRLEPMLHDLCRVLSPDGELWVSREYIGHPGGRMDERDRAAAAALVGGLSYRVHYADIGDSAATGVGADSIDGDIGRHGDRLLPWLRARFAPIEECASNALLWRTLPPAFAVSFELGRADDLRALRSAVVTDVLHQESGGRPVMLDGVYSASRH